MAQKWRMLSSFPLQRENKILCRLYLQLQPPWNYLQDLLPRRAIAPASLAFQILTGSEHVSGEAAELPEDGGLGSELEGTPGLAALGRFREEPGCKSLLEPQLELIVLGDHLCTETKSSCKVPPDHVYMECWPVCVCPACHPLPIPKISNSSPCVGGGGERERERERGLEQERGRVWGVDPLKLGTKAQQLDEVV